MNDLKEHSIIHDIQDEYKKIDDRWLKLHFYTFIALFVFGAAFEAIVGVLWFRAGAVEISSAQYIVKYFFAPILLNLCLVLAGVFIMRSRLENIKKIYAVSLLFVGGALVFYMVHSMFYALYLIFAIPILMTVVYSNYRLTTATALAGIGAKIVSDLFIVWDPDKIDPFSSDLVMTNFAISAFLLVLFYAVCMIVIRFEKEKNAASIQKEIEHFKTQQKLVIDDLTGAYNRTALRKAFQSMQEDPSESTYTFVMIDIDNFKALNDTLGHGKGDKCLREFAGILRKNCGEQATPFRFGGDEFCILYKNTPVENVIAGCKKIRGDLKNSAVSASDMPMTASFGIAAHEKGMPISRLLKNTDSALYEAKALKDAISVYGLA